jgi:hypothetical protein
LSIHDTSVTDNNIVIIGLQGSFKIYLDVARVR